MHQLKWRSYRKVVGGKPVSGNSGLVYSDGAAHEGYQLVLVDEANNIKVGDLISVGTSHELADEGDPRPALNSGNYGPGKKVVSSCWREVTSIGPVVEMVEDIVVEDEDHSYSGQRIVSQNRVKVRKVFFRRSVEAGRSY